MKEVTFDESRRELALALMHVGAVLTRESTHSLVVTRDGPNGPECGFRLKLHEKHPDAPLSPIFFNLRTPDNPKPGPLTPDIVELAALCMHHVAQTQCTGDFNAVVGIPNAGDPFAEALASITGLPRLGMTT